MSSQLLEKGIPVVIVEEPTDWMPIGSIWFIDEVDPPDKTFTYYIMEYSRSYGRWVNPRQISPMLRFSDVFPLSDW